MAASGIEGGESSAYAGVGVMVTGSAVAPSQGFTITRFDAETETTSGTYDGIQMLDVVGWNIIGGDVENQSGDGIHCEGGGGGVISGTYVGKNSGYNIDAGTSPILMHNCQLMYVSNRAGATSGTGDVNDPNHVVTGLPSLDGVGAYPYLSIIGALGQVTSNQYSGVSSCATGTQTITLPVTLAYAQQPAILVFDETNKGGANLTSKSKTQFVVSCTGASDTFDWVVIGNPN